MRRPFIFFASAGTAHLRKERVRQRIIDYTVGASELQEHRHVQVGGMSQDFSLHI
jgi:hypothetical protein